MLGLQSGLLSNLLEGPLCLHSIVVSADPHGDDMSSQLLALRRAVIDRTKDIETLSSAPRLECLLSLSAITYVSSKSVVDSTLPQEGEDGTNCGDNNSSSFSEKQAFKRQRHTPERGKVGEEAILNNDGDSAVAKDRRNRIKSRPFGL